MNDLLVRALDEVGDRTRARDILTAIGCDPSRNLTARRFGTFLAKVKDAFAKDMMVYDLLTEKYSSGTYVCRP